MMGLFDECGLVILPNTLGVSESDISDDLGFVYLFELWESLEWEAKLEMLAIPFSGQIAFAGHDSM